MIREEELRSGEEDTDHASSAFGRIHLPRPFIDFPLGELYFIKRRTPLGRP